MDDMIYKIAMAGMLHDIGKFMQRAELPLSELSKGMESSLCPVYKGIYSHKHVLWTSEFFEQFQKHPFMGGIQDQDSIANLAAYHHKASTKQQEIIQLADRLSSGSDRQEADENSVDRQHYKKTRMHSIFEYMSLSNKTIQSPTWRYELTPLDNAAQNSYPAPSNDLNPNEGTLLVDAYDKLFKDFSKDMLKINVKTAEHFMIAMLSLLEKYTWCIPSSTVDRPDISLYDHAKTTAAIAASLYSYHNDHGDLSSARLHSQDDGEKFILLVGDISGIQNYIFNIKNVGVGGTAKRLRARSFFLSLLSDIAAHKILHAFGMPLTNQLMSSGGKFYLLLPNTTGATDSINRLKKYFDNWCLEKLNGEVAVNIAFTQTSCKQLLSFNILLKTVNTLLQDSKNRPFYQLLTEGTGWNTNSFVFEHLQLKNEESLCQSCGKFAGVLRKEHEAVMCDHCNADVKFGGQLVRSKGVQFFRDGTGDYGVLDYSFSLIDNKHEASQKAYLNNIFNDWDFTRCQGALKPRYFANYIPVFEDSPCSVCDASDCNDKAHAITGNPKFFSCLAQASKGRKMMGILKADVDNLGLIFIKGFRDESEKAISRITTLSRLMDTFFTGRMDFLIRSEFKNIYTVYAGGDDLLLLGPWNDMLDFTLRLRKEFNAFCCGNPDFTLSAGLAVAKPRLPVYAAIKVADALLDTAKNQSALGAKISKNQLAIFNDIMKLDHCESLVLEAKKMAQWQGQKMISSSFSRLLLESGEMFKAFKQTGKTHNLRFSPLLAYSISRNISDKEPELLQWAQGLTDLTDPRLNNLVFIANYSISMNRR